MKVEFNKHLNGFHWRYESENGDELSIVCHDYSYGGTQGKFETMCSWLNDVQGFLSFAEVQRKISTIYRREKRSLEKV